MKPRIFISAVSSEFGQLRQLVANILQRLGYEPVWQDIFGTEAGDLRQMLRDKIDSCEGLIQLVGDAYGFEPADPDTEFGRVSYTQFEFLYGQKRHLKTWLIFAEQGCTRDREAGQLDLPREPDHPDPAGYQAIRRALQDQYRARLRQGGHLRHPVASDDQLALRVEQIKDELATLRRGFRKWQQMVVAGLAIAVLLTAFGVWWSIYRQPTHLAKSVAEELSELNPALIREQLRKQIEETHQQDLADADRLDGWEKRDAARQAAIDAKKRRLEQVDDFIDSISRRIESGESSPEYLELLRIVREEGVGEALKYIDKKQAVLLQRAQRQIAGSQQELRRTLTPLLEAVRLRRTRGEFEEALDLGKQVLLHDYNWPDAQHEQFVTLLELSRRALHFESLAAAKKFQDSARQSAERLTQINPRDDQAQRDMSTLHDWLGDLLLESGQVSEALQSYSLAMEIDRNRAKAKPADRRVQRKLSISFLKLGDVQRQSGLADAALQSYVEALKGFQHLADEAPDDGQARSDLSVAFERLGNAQGELGQTNEALQSYERALEISKSLAAANPADAQAQIDLSYSYLKLGYINTQLGRLDIANQLYRAGHAIREKQAATDEKNMAAQRNLAESHRGLADVLWLQGSLNEALDSYEKGLVIQQMLAEHDPENAQLQQDLSTTLERVGGLCQELGHLDKALQCFEGKRQIAERLVQIDQENARFQRDLSVAYDKMGSIQLRNQQESLAIHAFQQALRIRVQLAGNAPGDVRAQRDLSISHENIGHAQRQSGQLAEGIESYRKALAIRVKLADDAPSNAQAQRDLWRLYYQMGEAHRTGREFQIAAEWYEKAAEKVKEMQAAGVFHPLDKAIPDKLDTLIRQCQLAILANGAWSEIDALNESERLDALYYRVSGFAGQGDREGAIDALDRWTSLQPKEPGQLYSLACGHGIVLAALATANPQPSAEMERQRDQYRTAALDTLRRAIEAGFLDFRHMANNPDLASLRDLPEFREIINQDERGGVPEPIR